MSISFGLLHGDIVGAFLFSIFAIILTNKYKSLKGAIIMHIINNAIAVYNELNTYEIDEIYSDFGSSSLIWILVKSLVVIGIIVIVFRKNYNYIFE